MDTTTDSYQILKNSIGARKHFKTWSHEHVERYINTKFYAFTRGPVLVAVTSSKDTQKVDIDYHDYKEGDVLCNVLATGDCVTVTGGKVPVTLVGGEAKVFTPVDGATFVTE